MLTLCQEPQRLSLKLISVAMSLGEAKRTSSIHIQFIQQHFPQSNFIVPSYISAMNSDASALVGDLRNQLREDCEQYDREKLRETARKLSVALETPGDTIQRIAYLPLVTTVCRVATKLNLFNILVESHGLKSSKELAEETNADYDLLVRLLRYLAANNIIKEAGEDLWTANNITKNLT